MNNLDRVSGKIRFNRKSRFIAFRSEVNCDPFAKDFPFRGLFWRIHEKLRHLGYTYEVNPYMIDRYKFIAKDYITTKGPRKKVWMQANKFPAGFHIDLGTFQNLSGSRFRRHYDSDFTEESYLEKKRIDFTFRVISDLVKESFNGIEVVIEGNESPEEIILNNLKVNPHIHGDIKCLADIQKSIDERQNQYHRKHNAIDASGNEIRCGESRKFYSYRKGKRLMIGTVYHHINNMWWVICNGDIYNIPCFKLYPVNQDLPKRQGSEDLKLLYKMKMKESSMNSDFEKAIIFRNLIQKLNDTNSAKKQA